MIQKAQNYSAYSELLSVFRITPRIQNYSTYSELLHVFRITQRIHFLRGRAERRARNVSHLDRPRGVLSAYHALILVKCGGLSPPPPRQRKLGLAPQHPTQSLSQLAAEKVSNAQLIVSVT